jgi:hypothetical protein
VAYYSRHLDQPFTPNSQWTLRQLLFAMLMDHVSSGSSRDEVQARLCTLAAALPAGNTVPTSLKVAEELMGMESWQKFEVHLCTHPE